MSDPAIILAAGEHGLPESRRHWRHARLFAVAALFSAVALSGTSAWFLAAVALAGAGPAALTFNFHLPAALVRLFALTRTTTRYGERLAGHRAALLDQVARRSRLFVSMAAAPSVRAAGWQLSRADQLGDYLDDVEDVDHARLRIALPLTALACGGLGLALLTAWLSPLVLLPVGLLAIAGAVAVPSLYRRLRIDWDDLRSARAKAAAGFASAFAAIVPLRAENAWDAAAGPAVAGFDRADDIERHIHRRLAGFDAAARAAGPLVAVCCLLSGWHAGRTGGALLPLCFLAFGWMAFGEAASNLSGIVFGDVRRHAALARLSAWGGADGAAGRSVGLPAEAAAPVRDAARATVLVVDALQRVAPDGRAFGARIGFSCQPGAPVALTGASGCGKTTVLKQIAGWLPASGSPIALGGAPLPFGACHLGLHDAAILDDTVRENLFAPQASDAACWRALAAMELEGRVRAAGGLDGWLTQDGLSMGEAQRLNLARAWLSDAPVVLLDEPTEHLDAGQAARILSRLLARLNDRVVILATHRIDADEDEAARPAAVRQPRRLVLDDA